MITFVTAWCIVGVTAIAIIILKLLNNWKANCVVCEAELSREHYTEPSPLHTITVVDNELKCMDAIEHIMWYDQNQSVNYLKMHSFDCNWSFQ